MIGRRNSSLRRSFINALNALGAVALVAMPVFVSSVAFAAPEKPAPAADEKAAAKVDGGETAKSGAEKATEKATEKAAPKKKSHDKGHEKATKRDKKKTASKSSGGEKQERAKTSKKSSKKSHKKAHGAGTASKPAAASTDRSGILLSKPVMNAVDEPSHESATKKAHASAKEAAHAPNVKASAHSKSAGNEGAKGANSSSGSLSKASTAASKKSSKKASSRAKAARRRAKKGESGDKESSNQPCFGPAITVDRAGLEPESFPLVTCKGETLTEARERLSLLARPWGMIRPDRPGIVWGASASRTGHEESGGRSRSRRAKTERERELDPIEVAPGVRRVDEGLVARLDAVTRKFPGKVVSLVSGYRPQSRGSLHQSARALDLRVAGVSNEDLVAFCKSLPDTGCGYYPNSSFVHMDVRLPGTGSVSWIDASGPGESPRYVARWPETAADASPPPFSPPVRGDATEMGHDLGASGSPSAPSAASPSAHSASSGDLKGDDDVVPAPLFEDPPNL